MPARCSFRISAAWSPAVIGRPSRLAIHSSVGQARPGPFLQDLALEGGEHRQHGSHRSPCRCRQIQRLGQAKRNPLRDGPVPEVLPADPLPSVPSDPVARPAPRRSHDAGRPRAVFHALLASPPRSLPRGPAKRWSSRAGRHTPSGRGSASPESAGHSSKRAYRGPHETFSLASVSGRKRGRILSSGKPVLWAFRNVTQPWPQTILFGQAGFIILRGSGCSEPRQRVPVIPGHPLRRVPLQLLSMPQ